jgi:hypothetical protein
VAGSIKEIFYTRMRGAIQQTFRQYSMDIQSGGDEFSVRPDDQYGSPT